MTTRKGSKSIKGTDLKVGDILCRWPKGTRITKVEPKQHQLGARYQVVTSADGEVNDCWEGFLYHIECDIEITLLNSTPTMMLNDSGELRHRFCWSGRFMPCTGVYKCIYCGLVADCTPVDYSKVNRTEECPVLAMHDAAETNS